MKKDILQNIDIEEFQNNIYLFLIELDKFKKESYHRIFYYSYLSKTKYSQEKIGKEIGMDQSTISRKASEIQNYIIVKINEIK